MTTATSNNAAGNTPEEAAAVAVVTAVATAAVAKLIALEREAIAAATGPLRAALRRILAKTSANYIHYFGSLTAPADPVKAQALVTTFVSDLEELRSFDVTAPLTHFAEQALVKGINDAVRPLPAPTPTAIVKQDKNTVKKETLSPKTVPEIAPPPIKELETAVEPSLTKVSSNAVSLPDNVKQAISSVSSSVDAAVTQAQTFAEALPITGFDDLVATMAKTSQVTTPVERASRWAVNHSYNAGIRATALKNNARLLWLAEPDACQVCLALSGDIADPGIGLGFDEEATFGKPGSAPPVWPPNQPLMQPPRHVNCLPGSALVSSRSKITGATSRIYNGELVEIRTLSQKIFTATPNHPVLTNNGWIAIGALHQGSYVVSDTRTDTVSQRIDHVMVALPGPVITSEISSDSFHGDGFGSTSVTIRGGDKSSDTVIADSDEFIQSFIGGVQTVLDEVIEIQRYPFRGHVYNLETEEGWYIGNGIVTHNCRCRLQVWKEPTGSDTAGGPEENALYNQPETAAGVDLPAALKREAKRSILLGTRRPSEPEPDRIDAASRLLQRGAGLPKSVETKARKSVANKHFPVKP